MRLDLCVSCARGRLGLEGDYFWIAHVREAAKTLLMMTQAFVGAYLLSVAFFLVRSTCARRRIVLFIGIALLTLACPLCVSRDHPVIRCLLATTFVFFVIKGWDVHLHPSSYRDLRVREYIIFLMNHCSFVPGKPHDTRAYPRIGQRVRYFVIRTAHIVLASALLFVVFQCNWTAYSFWPEHVVKALCSLVWIVCAFKLYGAIWRMSGTRTKAYATNLWSIGTPADFWRRCHKLAHQWFYQDVFRQAGGTRHPTPALWLTFVVSGLLHEYIISISLGRVTGYMLLFFVLQGVATSLTWRCVPSGAARVAGFMLTYAFLATSSVYFFVAVNEGISFYANPVPSWIWLW